MIKSKTPIVNKPSISDDEFGEKYFIVGKKIVPVRPIDHSSIIQLDEIPENSVVLSENKLQQSIRENKTNNRFALFFNKVKLYLNSLESFLKGFRRLQLVDLTQKKILLEIEKKEQNIKTYRAKKLVEDTIEDSDEKKTINLEDYPSFAAKLAAILGLGSGAAAASQGTTQVYGDVVGQGEFAVDSSGEQTQRVPAWIPFPKGTQGLVFTSGFGYQNWRGYEHGGIDIAGTVGTPIITPITGIVSAAGWDDGGYGNWVVINSGSVEMIFGHMHQTPPVRSGQQVQAGTVIGGIGNTGRSTGPHLHWTIKVDGRKVDPALWTQSNRPGTSTAGARSNNQQPMDPESEGAFMTNKRILVGEAGPELLIPMSQMPLFVQGMLEEKMRSLNPMYEVSAGFDSGIEKFSGSAKTSFASGGIAGGSPEFWQMVAISATEDIRHPQGQADVAQSIYNRIAVGSYPGGKNIINIITADGQYQPTFKNPGQWRSIRDRASAINAVKILPYVGKNAPALIDMGAKSITNPVLQKEAARFVGGRTDFMGESQKDSMKPNDITRGRDHNYFGWFYDARLPKAAPIHHSVKSITNTVSTPTKSKPKDLNLIERFMLLINPPRSKKAELTDINGSDQMIISNEYQKQFVSTNTMIVFYKPTVEYPEMV